MQSQKLLVCLSYFVCVSFTIGCGSTMKPIAAKSRLSADAVVRRSVPIEYASSLEPYVDAKGDLIIPGQKLGRWSGRSFAGSSRFDIVPLD